MRIRVGISKESLFLFFSLLLVFCEKETDAKLVAPVIRLSLFLSIELKSQKPKSDLTRYDRRRYLSIAKPGKSNKKHKTKQELVV